MSVIGLDFGSHVSSIALWFEDKDVVEVIADDLGSRTIPSFVGFRSGEVIVGEAALSQYHKNASNTFQDVRSMILDPEIKNVFIPVLEKEVLVQEVVSHYFRNIHNQIKQQVGKAVRECILSIPMTLDDSIKERLFEAAQSGGIRIKSIINNSSSSLLAYQFDDSSITSAQVMVIDVGWSLTEASVTTVSGGLFFPLSKSSSTSICGKVLVNLLADHCAKDFQRKAKVLCSDNSKSMMRLRRECEESMKHLSTGQESTIDIDSLCEGIDYSSKISRARFEDLASIPFMRLKNLVNEVLDSASLTVENISHVCIIGGLSAMPKVIQTIKGIFPNALYPRGKFESNETQCIGAALYGKYLFQQGLLESVPLQSPVAIGLSRPILITSNKIENAITVFPYKTVLPTSKSIPAQIKQSKGYLQILAGIESSLDQSENTVLGEVVFEVESASEETPVNVKIVVSVNSDSSIKLEVISEDGNKNFVSFLIPSP